MSAVTSSTTTTTTSTTAPSTSSSSASYTSSSSTSSSSSSSSASSYTSAASAQLSSLAQHSKDSVKSLGNRPTSMRCSGCASDLAIPPTVWQWQCTKSHVNPYEAAQCSTCQEPRGPSVHWPAMLCERCGTVTTVPGSEMESALKGTFASLKSSLHGFIDPPKLFHCENCNTSLVVPQGPWTCQACTQINSATVVKCTRCTQSKAAQRVLCGHCHKATAVPENGLVDVVKSGLASASRFATKGWMDLIGQANVQCPSCKNPVKLPSHVPTTGVSPSVDATPSTTAPVATSALPPAPQGIPATEWQIPLTCDQCHHSFSVGRGSTGGAQGVGSGAPGGAKSMDMQVALVAPTDSASTSTV